MSDIKIEIDAAKITWGDFRKLSESFSLAGVHSLLKKCSNLSEEQLDALSLVDVREVMQALGDAIKGAFVPKAN